MVITSHFHYDHIGYLSLFERAQVVSGQKEFDYWFGKRDANALGGEFTTEQNLVPVDKAHKEGRLRLISEATEVFPGITVYQVGGHCPGEVVVAGNQGQALVTGNRRGPFLRAAGARVAVLRVHRPRRNEKRIALYGRSRRGA
jgi:glyoxylase-like metal-dependent hydrolase (beta-lactamase superfamily II)